MTLKNQQVFVVDDDESVCRALSMLLSTYGFIVDAFTCAEGFFQAVPNSVSGCLVMDIHMPGVDGWKALQRIKESGSSRPVIMISADKNEELNEKALKAGAAGFLQKPFNDQALVDLIKAALENEK
ncbi:MAG: response regulator [Candidatus Omnitrophota bacterium]